MRVESMEDIISHDLTGTAVIGRMTPQYARKFLKQLTTYEGKRPAWFTVRLCRELKRDISTLDATDIDNVDNKTLNYELSRLLDKVKAVVARNHIELGKVIEREKIRDLYYIVKEQARAMGELADILKLPRQKRGKALKEEQA